MYLRELFFGELVDGSVKGISDFITVGEVDGVADHDLADGLEGNLGFDEDGLSIRG